MVYCVAFGIQKIALPTETAEFEDNCCSVLLLTFACVLCLPLHRFAVRQVEIDKEAGEQGLFQGDRDHHL